MIHSATNKIEEQTDPYTTTAELYDHVGPYRTRGDVEFYVNIAKEVGGRVLEIGCGTGRILIPTAEAGIDITGLDASRAMLGVLESNLASQPKQVQDRVHLEQGDMRNFDLDEQFDLITIPFRPFQHLLTVEDQLACLASVRRHMKPHGKFVFDVFNPSIPGLADETKLEQAQPEPEVTMPDGRRFIRTHRFLKKDFLNQINDLELVHHVICPDGRKTEEIFAFQMRYLFRFELEHLLVRAGFAIESLYSGFDKAAYGERYPGDLIVLAGKG